MRLKKEILFAGSIAIIIVALLLVNHFQTPNDQTGAEAAQDFIDERTTLTDTDNQQESDSEKSASEDKEIDDSEDQAGVEDRGETMSTVVMETSKGNIEIELNAEKAPITVENFLSYVDEGYYDGTIFHRVIEGFMIQGGGFNTEHNEKQTKAPIRLESGNGLKNDRATIAMARTNVADSATSQFFINVVDNAMLNNAPGNDGYAVFGKVTSGLEVVDAIKGVETANNGPHGDWPVEDVVINKVYVKQ